MRVSSFAAAILMVAAPAALRAAPPHAQTDEDVVRSLPRDDQIEATGEALDRALDALLNVNVGPIADAIDPERPRYGRNETVGDMAGRDDPHFRDRMHRDVGTMTDSMHVMRERMAVLVPALKRSMEDLERSMDEATRDLPSRHNR